jgi:hypothetical protein
MRFCGLALHDPVPDAKTIWLYREQLTRAGTIDRLFSHFDAALRERGYLAMGGQIVDATVIEARWPRLNRAEKETIKKGGIPEDWKPARIRQIDRDGRWTLKRGRKRPELPDHSPSDSSGQKRQATEIVVPIFGYKNHVGIDRTHGFIRKASAPRRMVQSIEFRQDSLWGFGPDEGSRIVVVVVEVSGDGGLEVDDGAEHAALEASASRRRSRRH